MKQLWLFIAGLFLGALAIAQHPDSSAMPTITLADVSIIDFRNDNPEVFKSIDLNVNSKANRINSDLGDLIQNSAPIYFKNYSVGGIKTIDLRGTGSERTKVYWNGIPINSPTLGSFDFSLLPFYFVEDARLRLGGASLTDGGGGLGGSVQLLNSASFESNLMEISGSYGSFDSYSIAAKGLFSLNKFKSDSRVFFLKAQNDYTYTNEYKNGHPTENRINNEVAQFGFQQIFSYKLNAKNLLSARFTLTDSDRNIPPPVSSSGGGAKQYDDLIIGQLGWDWMPLKQSYLKVRTGFQNQKNRYYIKDFINASTLVNGWNNNMDFGYYGIDHLKLRASFRFDRYWVNSDGAGQVTEDQITGLINADWQVARRIELVFGARVKTITGSSSPLMPYGGIVWKIPDNGGSIQSNVSQVYRFPTINDRYWIPGGNTNLEPEHGWNYELGYNYKNNFRILDLEIGINTFYGQINQWIIWHPSANNPLFWEAQNIWKVINKGLEFTLKTSTEFSNSSSLSFGLNYTYTRPTVAEINNADNQIIGKQLILVPMHQVLVPIQFYWNNFNAMINYRFVSKRFTDRLNVLDLDAYNLIDIVIGYAFKNPPVKANFSVNNLLNKQYETVPGQPLAGINFNIEITWSIF